MKYEFVKMHGAGNDYVYVDCFKNAIHDPNKLSMLVSDRHKGIGADGLVMICPSDVADAKMRMFNADGSEGNMCGNAIRCVTKYLFDNGYVDKDNITIETKSGIKSIKVKTENNRFVSAAVNMGKAVFEPTLIPVEYSISIIARSLGWLQLSRRISIPSSEIICFTTLAVLILWIRRIGLLIM